MHLDRLDGEIASHPSRKNNGMAKVGQDHLLHWSLAGLKL
jgi:hypothetical protein